MPRASAELPQSFSTAFQSYLRASPEQATNSQLKTMSLCDRPGSSSSGRRDTFSPDPKFNFFSKSGPFSFEKWFPPA